MIAISVDRPADRLLRLIRAGRLPAIIIVAVIAFRSSDFETSKECTAGSFTGGFSNGFDVRRCEFKFRINNGPELKFTLFI